MEGKGIIYFNNGNRYEGKYKNVKAEGKRILYYKNGNKYEGEFKMGKKKEKENFMVIMIIDMKGI